jgi:calcineurin-like phosphoesterase family protein
MKNITNEPWIWSDPHFQHPNIIHYENRPSNYESLILNNYNHVVQHDDISICLGDVFLGNSSKWDDYIPKMNGRKILVVGNHDTKSYRYYMSHGFNFACDTFTWHLHTYNIIFSHSPLQLDLLAHFDYNIHGHLHSGGNHRVNLSSKHILYAPELEDYRPIKLKSIIDRHRKRSACQ